jgi:hypothetical protein
MNCEFCGRWLLEDEVAHGIRFGTVDVKAGLFLPARESAVTVICQKCGSMVLKVVYSGIKRITVIPTGHP